MADPSPDDPALYAADTPDLILLAARYLLLQLHRHRKAELIGRARPSSSAPSIVAPIVQGLVHIRQTRSVRQDLSKLGEALRRAGLGVDVQTAWSSETAEAGPARGVEAIWSLMSGTLSLEVVGL